MAKNSSPDETKVAESKVALEQHFTKNQTPAWLRAAMLAKFKWPQGYGLTENEFSDAVSATTGEVIR